MAASHLLAIERTGAKQNATNEHLGNEKATATRIAAINVDMMTTSTQGVGSGARARKMALHEDRFCWRRPWSDFIREVGSRGGVNGVDPETY